MSAQDKWIQLELDFREEDEIAEEESLWDK